MLIIDDLTSLRRDVYVYRLLIQEFRKRIRRNSVSRYVGKKVCANFAEDSTHIPMLKYESKTGWGTSVFGADSVVRIEVFRKNVQLDKIMQDIPLQDSIPIYSRDELVDPMIFEEWLAIYSKLKPHQISWLATHRTRRHTYKCVSYNWNLWKFHIDRIFQQLLDNPDLGENIDDPLIEFTEKEIDESARNARQALDKIENRDASRYEVIQWLTALVKTLPLAMQIRQTIEPPFKINRRVILKARIRKCFTTILRLYLTKFGLSSDRRKVRRPMKSYLIRLENYLLQLGSDRKSRIEAIGSVLQDDNPRLTLRILYKFFIQISVIEDYKSWFDDKQLLLDQWVG